MAYRVYEALRSGSFDSDTDVARHIGCQISYVCDVRLRYGLGRRSATIYVTLDPDDENIAWLVREAETANVTVKQMLNAILTDARLDNE